MTLNKEKVDIDALCSLAMDRYVRLKRDIVLTADEKDCLPMFEWHTVKDGEPTAQLVCVPFAQDVGAQNTVLEASLWMLDMFGPPRAIILSSEGWTSPAKVLDDMVKAGQLNELGELGDPDVQECLTVIGVGHNLESCMMNRLFSWDGDRLNIHELKKSSDAGGGIVEILVNIMAFAHERDVRSN
jgi:hypothetical protein